MLRLLNWLYFMCLFIFRGRKRVNQLLCKRALEAANEALKEQDWVNGFCRPRDQDNNRLQDEMKKFLKDRGL